jgi:hypothetical protein
VGQLGIATSVIIPHPPSPDLRWSGGWERRDYLELGALETAPGSARGHVVNVLREWGLSILEEAAEMVTSELLTNSVKATRAVRWPGARPPVRLWLLGDHARACVLAWDAVLAFAPSFTAAPPFTTASLPALDSPGDPVLAADAMPAVAAVLGAGRRAKAGTDAENGRGLLIVDALSTDWGCYACPAGTLGGKVTWALMGGSDL